MQPMPEVPAQSFGPDGALMHDTPCRRCGYNLRGLRENGNCPECGTPVGRSVMGDLLRFADPAWLRQISTGLSMLLWLILLHILVSCLTGGVSAAARGASVVARGASSASGLSAAASVALAAVSLVAMWKVTSPDPSGLGEESQFNARSIVRFVTGASFAVTVAVLLMSLISANPVMFMVIALLGFANSLMVVIAEWYKYKLYEYLASRIPDRMMISRARTIRWIGVIFLLIGVIAGVLGMVVLRPPAGGMAPTMAGAGIALIIIGAVGGLGLLVYAVMGVFYLFRLRKGINEQLRMAEMIWSTAPLARAAGSPPSPL